MLGSLALRLDARPLPAEAAAAAIRPRIAFLDLARVAATLMMVLGHTVDALLDSGYRDTQAFHAWTWARGLTPSTFLFVAGFTFGIVTLRAAGRRAGNQTARRLRRGAFLIAVGYALHYPAANVFGIWSASPEAWRSFLAIDVLQAIGATLIVLQLIAVAFPSPRRFLAPALALAGTTALLAPLAWSIDWEAWVAPALAAYLTPRTGSLFPLFPWLAYGALGAALSAWFLLDSSVSPVHRALRTLLPAGLVMYGAALLCRLAGWEPMMASGGGARMSQFLLQAGLVCLIVSVVAATSTFAPRRSLPVEALARHALVVYVVHICVIYGSPWIPGLRHVIGRTLPPLTVLAVVMVMWGVMAMLVVGWNHCNRQRPVLARRLRFGVMGALLMVLLI